MFKQSTIAYLFDIFGLLAGLIIIYQLDVFTRTSWTLALYPTLISTRVISGLLSGRLSTALHLGTIYPRYSNNTKSFHKLMEAIIVLTLITSLGISAISFLVGSIFWGITFTDFYSITIVMLSTLAIGLTFTFIIVKVAFVSFKHGFDPDIVVYPVISIGASIFITLCYIGVLELFFNNSNIGILLILAIGLAHVILAGYVTVRNRREPEFTRTIKESFLMLILVAVIVTLSGTIFKNINNFARDRREIYTIYPALINNISNVGSVVGSTANTKLALGLLLPTFSSIRNHGKNILSAIVASFLVFTVLALISLAVNNIWSLESTINFLAIIWASNIIAVVAIVVLSYEVAIITFKRGLNPETFAIPIVTSLATIITTAAILAALIAIR